MQAGTAGVTPGVAGGGIPKAKARRQAAAVAARCAVTQAVSAARCAVASAP